MRDDVSGVGLGGDVVGLTVEVLADLVSVEWESPKTAFASYERWPTPEFKVE